MLVIFDCDGVLVDSETIAAEVLSHCFISEGLALRAQDVIETYRGKSVPDCIDIATQALAALPAWQSLSAEEQVVRGAHFWRVMQLKTLDACSARLEPIPGVEAVLQLLQDRGVPFCVASNGKHEKMAVTLEKTGLLQYLKGRVFSFEDVKRGKPAPDLFLHAASTLGIAPQETVVIEDSLTGLQAALAAGMRPLAFCPPDHEGRDNYLLPQVQAMDVTHFSDMTELPGLLLGDLK